MKINFTTSGTDKRKIVIKFENEIEFSDFITTLSVTDSADWIYKITLDFSTLTCEIDFYL